MPFCLFLHVHLSCEFFKKKKTKLKNDKKEFRVIRTKNKKSLHFKNRLFENFPLIASADLTRPFVKHFPLLSRSEIGGGRCIDRNEDNSNKLSSFLAEEKRFSLHVHAGSIVISAYAKSSVHTH